MTTLEKILRATTDSEHVNQHSSINEQGLGSINLHLAKLLSRNWFAPHHMW